MRLREECRMTTLREAAQQALEALEVARPLMQPVNFRDWGGPRAAAYEQHGRAITALRAALEQPEQEQEPVATVAMDVSRVHVLYGGQYLGQKPDSKIAMLLKDLPVGTLLFTHPPRREWRGLTDKEIGDAFNATNDYNAFARAIEQALKEKNHE